MFGLDVFDDEEADPPPPPPAPTPVSPERDRGGAWSDAAVAGLPGVSAEETELEWVDPEQEWRTLTRSGEILWTERAFERLQADFLRDAPRTR